MVVDAPSEHGAGSRKTEEGVNLRVCSSASQHKPLGCMVGGSKSISDGAHVRKRTCTEALPTRLGPAKKVKQRPPITIRQNNTERQFQNSHWVSAVGCSLCVRCEGAAIVQRLCHLHCCVLSWIK